MVGRTERLIIAKEAAGILRDSGAIERFRSRGYTRIDPFEIAASVDLAVMMRPLEGLLGAFLRDEQSGILVNADRPPGLMHMTCAHELGHYFLGHETTTDYDLDYGPTADPKEREADWFAYHLLMPRQLIVDLMKRKGWQLAELREPAKLYQLSLRLGTSFTATLWTLISLNMLPVGQAEAQRLARTPLQRLKHDILSWAPQEETLSDVWILDENDRDRILEPRPQDRFVVDLPSRASAGYLWSLEEATDAGFTLRPLTVSAGPVRPSMTAPAIVGGGTRQRYILEHAIHAGAYVPEDSLPLEFRECKPWKSDDANASFAMATEFEAIELGLDVRSRERLLAEVAAP